MTKTLYRKYSSESDVIAEIETMNNLLGYQVFDTGKVWRAQNTTHTWIQPAFEGNGAISWEFVKDWIE